MTDLQKAQYIASEAQKRGADLCGSFEDWTLCAMALAELGEDGRQIFHALASANESYKAAESERKFTNCMHTTKRTGLGSLIRHAEQHGIKLPKDGTRYTPTFKVLKPKPKAQPEAVQVLPPNGYLPYLRGNSNPFVNGLAQIFGTEAVAAVAKAYNLGSSPRGERVVFFLMDAQGRYRGGKVMQYNADLHRSKDANGKPMGVSWTHSEQHIKGFRVTACLFGEHLLQQHPSAVVCVVESEKTALIGALLHPSCVWVAMGGTNYTLLAALKGRKVVIFPDADQWQAWKQQPHKLADIKQHAQGLHAFKISAWADAEPEGSKRDIADLMLEQAQQKTE